MNIPTPTIQLIHDALIVGFDGYGLSDGSVLRAGSNPDDIEKVGDGELPYLLFDEGRISFQRWTDFEDFASWDIPAKLKIGGDPETISRDSLAACQDLLFRSKQIIGLPILEDGTLLPFSDATQALFDQGKVGFLAERGAPYPQSFDIQPSKGKYQVTNLIFHVEATLSLDPRAPMPIARVASLGLLPVAPARVIQDPYAPDGKGYQIIAPSDSYAWTGYNSKLPPMGDTSSQPIGGQAINMVQGVPLSSQVRSIVVTPYAASLSIGTPTAQLAGIATFANWASQYVTQTGTWTSDTPSVATVSTGGLVTRVSAGSANVTCTYQGVASNAVAIIVS